MPTLLRIFLCRITGNKKCGGHIVPPEELQPGDRLPPELKRGASGGSIVKEISPTQGIKLLTEYLNIKKMSLNDLIQVRKLCEESSGK